MCSIEEGDNIVMPQKTEIKLDKKCMKCGETAVAVIRAGDSFCKECLLLYCTHRFRSGFGKSKLVRDREPVLVAFTGGPSSSAMIHLIQEGLSRRAQKKLRFLPSLVYIDEGVVIGQSENDRAQTTADIEERMRQTGLDYSVHPLQQPMQASECLPIETVPMTSTLPWKMEIQYLLTLQILNPSCMEGTKSLSPGAGIERIDLNSAPENTANGVQERQLIKLLLATKTLTAKQALIHCLRQRLLVEVARKKGIGKVLTGENATRLSIQMLSGITQGHGASLPQDVGFADDRHSDVTLIRPMRELTSKEIAVYNRLCGVDSHVIPSLDTKLGALTSLERLTEEFVVGLQTDHPNTVPTILRTGEKLQQVESVDGDHESTCCMCHARLDTDVTSSSALAATEASRSITNNLRNKTDQVASSSGGTAACDTRAGSTQGGCGSGTEGGCASSVTDACCGEGDGECKSGKISRLNKEELQMFLCYSCRCHVKDITDISTLPVYIMEEAERRHRRANMRDSIADFLLPDEENS